MLYLLAILQQFYENSLANGKAKRKPKTPQGMTVLHKTILWEGSSEKKSAEEKKDFIQN